MGTSAKKKVSVAPVSIRTDDGLERCIEKYRKLAEPLMRAAEECDKNIDRRLVVNARAEDF